MGTSSQGAEALFVAALALPASERRAYLQRACSDDREQYVLVDDLLNAFPHVSSFIKERLCIGEGEELGNRAGGYRLMHELGEGGCGVVYLAEQLAPIKREVALKIIKLGMDTKAVVSRFEAERQALAMMDHPNIAKVFDAGATPTGRPYFVMELVRGIKITAYCDQCRLTIPERLELFIQVCRAIQHAHVKGVIHRDIKPSNVLVTLHDGLPIVKVIDFGIAKAMQGRLTDHTIHTVVDQFIGTPAYVSPEQVEAGGVNVDTRSDIYSLGVLLYELLTGCTPFDNEELLHSGLERMCQRIREEEPPGPSTRVRTSADESVSRTRQPHQGTSNALSEYINGDLDCIVLHCLEKQRDRRYQTAGGLAEDLQRHLDDLPISVKPRTMLYAVRKFARRNRSVFYTGFAILAVSLIATTVSTWQAVRATRAERLAARTVDSLVRVFSAADPYSNQDADSTISEMLDRAGRTAREDMTRHPTIQAQLLEAVGRIYRRRGDLDRSIASLEEAVRIRRNLVGSDGKNAPEFLAAMNDLALARRMADDLQAAQSLTLAAMNAARRFGLQRSVEYSHLLSNLAYVMRETGDVDAALRHMRASVELRRDLLGPEHMEVAAGLASLAGHLSWSDDLDGAERTAREALAILQTASPLHPERMNADVVLAAVLTYRGQFDAAAELQEDLLRRHRRVYGENSIEVASTLSALSRSHAAGARYAKAKALAIESVRIAELTDGPEQLGTAYYRTTLAHVLEQCSEYDEAARQIRRALATYAKHGFNDHQHTASSEYILGEILLSSDQVGEAESVLRSSIDRWKRTSAPEWRAARSASALGAALQRLGRIREAETLLVDSYRTISNAPGADHEARSRARERVVDFYKARRRQGKLGELLAENQGAVVN